MHFGIPGSEKHSVQNAVASIEIIAITKYLKLLSESMLVDMAISTPTIIAHIAI